jgi:hypothetical protein
MMSISEDLYRLFGIVWRLSMVCNKATVINPV